MLKYEKSYKRQPAHRNRNAEPDLPLKSSSQFQKNQNLLIMGSNRKDRSLERKMTRTINSEMNSQISGKNLSEFSIKFEGLSDTYSKNETQDIDDGRSVII